MDSAPHGLPLYIGYQDVMVSSPDGRSTLHWRYVTEPPHGDGLFSLSCNGIELPGLFWGRGHAWSTDSDYFCAEHLNAVQESALIVVRLADGKWFRIASSASVERFIYPVIQFHGYASKESRSYTFTGAERWRRPAA